MIIGIVVGITNQFNRCNIRAMSNVDILSRPYIGQIVLIKVVDDMEVKAIICYKASIKIIVSYTNHGSGHVSV